MVEATFHAELFKKKESDNLMMKINTQKLRVAALLTALIIGVVLISGCTNSNNTSTKADYEGFNNEFKNYWDDVVTSTQAKNNRQFFSAYKI